MPLDAAWSNGETFDGASFSSLVAQVNTNETAISTKQAADGDLTAIGNLTPANDDVLQRKAGAWTSRTIAQFKTDLGAPPTHTHTSTDITDFAEAVQDTMNTTLVPGAGITLSYSDVANTLTVSAPSGGASNDALLATATGRAIAFSLFLG